MILNLFLTATININVISEGKMQERLLTDSRYTQSDNQHSLKYWISAFPCGHEREEAATLTYLALFETSPHPDGPTDYCSWHFLSELSKIPQQDRENVVKIHSAPLFNCSMQVFERIKLVNTIKGCTVNQREDIITRTSTIVKLAQEPEINDGSYIIRKIESDVNCYCNFLKAFNKVELHERESLLNDGNQVYEWSNSTREKHEQTSGALSLFFLAHFMDILSPVQQIHRQIIIDTLKTFKYIENTTNGMSVNALLLSLTRLNPNDVIQVVNLSMKCINGFLQKVLNDQQKQLREEGTCSYYEVFLSDYCYPFLIGYLGNCSSETEERLQFYEMFHQALEYQDGEDPSKVDTEEEKNKARDKYKTRICDLIFYKSHPKDLNKA